MAFAVLRIEIGPYGEQPRREPLEIGLRTKQEAAAYAENWVSQCEEHGCNEEHGFWWGTRDGQQFWLVIEGQ